MSISKESPIIKSNKNPHDKLLVKNKHGHDQGENPLSIDIKLLEDAGHQNIPKSKIIRKTCLNCCGFEVGEVRKCVCTTCPLWPYRMGVDPFISAKRKKI